LHSVSYFIFFLKKSIFNLFSLLNLLKKAAKNDNNQARLIEEMRVLLKPFQESQHLEVQERACFASELLLLYCKLV